MNEDRRYASDYLSGIRSANPRPLCRKGGCGERTTDGSEYCGLHAAVIEAGQAWAIGERNSLRWQGRLRQFEGKR